MGRKIADLGFFTSLGIILGYVDTLIPVFSGVPGIKLGLANLAVLFVLYRHGIRSAGMVSFIRILAVGFLFGNLFSIFYSLAGGFLSLSVMALLKKSHRFSMIGVSIVGGVSHNVGQILAAMAVVESPSVLYYLPVLLISGVITGFCIGTAALEVWKRIGKEYE